MKTGDEIGVRSDLYAVLQKIATGPELSKDLSEEESRQAMSLVLDNSVDEVQAAVFLIALRMKRETYDELRGALRALLDYSLRVTADVPDVVDLADPFDGYVRTLPAAPFLPAVLAACGIPTVSHGAESLGPKYGATHFKVLRAAGAKVDLDPAGAAKQIGDPDIGWAYVDQRYTNPALHRLRDLRAKIVKRPCLTTLEVALKPVCGSRATHLLTGYVHKAYPPIYSMLARVSGYESAMIVRGVEGGVIASLNQPSRLTRFSEGGEDEEIRLDPTDAGIQSASRAVPLPQKMPMASMPQPGAQAIDSDAIASKAAEVGRDALAGRPGPTRSSLIYSASQCLVHLRQVGTLRDGVGIVTAAIDSGAARRRFEAG
jgi:anthranilate phosphoribosyltransferase